MWSMETTDRVPLHFTPDISGIFSILLIRSIITTIKNSRNVIISHFNLMLKTVLSKGMIMRMEKNYEYLFRI